MRVIRKFETAVNKEWPAAEVRLFRFGSQITQLATQDRLAPLRPSFHEAQQGFIDTHIDRAIEAADQSRLTVLTTDLFQTDTDVTQVTRQLIDRYAARRLVIGVLGVKADFRGEVYDVGIIRLRFHFDGMRPFYAPAWIFAANSELTCRAVFVSGG